MKNQKQIKNKNLGKNKLLHEAKIQIEAQVAKREAKIIKETLEKKVPFPKKSLTVMMEAYKKGFKLPFNPQGAWKYRIYKIKEKITSILKTEYKTEKEIYTLSGKFFYNMMDFMISLTNELIYSLQEHKNNINNKIQNVQESEAYMRCSQAIIPLETFMPIFYKDKVTKNWFWYPINFEVINPNMELPFPLENIDKIYYEDQVLVCTFIKNLKILRNQGIFEKKINTYFSNLKTLIMLCLETMFIENRFYDFIQNESGGLIIDRPESLKKKMQDHLKHIKKLLNKAFDTKKGKPKEIQTKINASYSDDMKFLGKTMDSYFAKTENQKMLNSGTITLCAQINPEINPKVGPEVANPNILNIFLLMTNTFEQLDFIMQIKDKEKKIQILPDEVKQYFEICITKLKQAAGAYGEHWVKINMVKPTEKRQKEKETEFMQILNRQINTMAEKLNFICAKILTVNKLYFFAKHYQDNFLKEISHENALELNKKIDSNIWFSENSWFNKEAIMYVKSPDYNQDFSYIKNPHNKTIRLEILLLQEPSRLFFFNQIDKARNYLNKLLAFKDSFNKEIISSPLSTLSTLSTDETDETIYKMVYAMLNYAKISESNKKLYFSVRKIFTKIKTPMSIIDLNNTDDDGLNWNGFIGLFFMDYANKSIITTEKVVAFFHKITTSMTLSSTITNPVIFDKVLEAWARISTYVSIYESLQLKFNNELQQLPASAKEKLIMNDETVKVLSDIFNKSLAEFFDCRNYLDSLDTRFENMGVISSKFKPGEVMILINQMENCYFLKIYPLCALFNSFILKLTPEEHFPFKPVLQNKSFLKYNFKNIIL